LRWLWRARVGCLYLARTEIAQEVQGSLLREQARILPQGVQADAHTTATRLTALVDKRVISDKGHVILSPEGKLLWGRITLSPPLMDFPMSFFATGALIGAKAAR
jgi:hypothetical protein